ncbi:MAG: hypothetical protein RMI89_01695 [Gloeomargarita sp. SKYBB_i_bin120]|nr:hypothetical protein [Gloeomargarita sp. SKYB120]MDW8177235.1 hypothetical protein [Gloeomargarita sp. SKYBB_i_bin120]
MSLATLRQAQASTGAQFHPDGFPWIFGQEINTRNQLETGVILFDRTHWGRLLLQGADRMRYLHNQSTNDIQKLSVGQGCDTVFVTSTARTIDLVSAYIEPEQIRLVISPGQRQRIIQWLEKYIFFADHVTVLDHTDATAMFTLIGPGSHELVAQLGAADLTAQPLGNHTVIAWENAPVWIAVGSGLVTPGYTIIVPVEMATDFWQWCRQQGAIPWGEQAWEWLRIEQGRPAVGAELTEDYNPFEAGLWHCVSLQKGCYIGQETLARLNTYQGVKQQLWGLKLTAPATPGTPIYLGEEKVGVLTSYTHSFQEEHRGLGYIRTKAGGVGLMVQVDGKTAEVVDLPFAHRGYLAQLQG